MIAHENMRTPILGNELSEGIYLFLHLLSPAYAGWPMIRFRSLAGSSSQESDMHGAIVH